VLLKVVLLAYSRGIVGSRRIEAACRENVLFMAVSGDSAPHFTTIAEFVSGLARIFQCAVKRRCLSVGANPARQLSLRPVATGAIVEVTKQLKPLVQRVMQVTRRACRP
jgi:hypothetical protein